MEIWITTGILLCGIFIGLYGYHLYRARSKKPVVPSSLPKQERQSVDIMGKSKYNLVLSGTSGDIGKPNEKPIENTPIFAQKQKQEEPVDNRPLIERAKEFYNPEEVEKLEGVVLDLSKWNDPPAYPKESPGEKTEVWQEESDPSFIRSPPVATGISFEEMSKAIDTVMNYPKANYKDQIEAGKILQNMQQTTMFDQLAAIPFKAEVIHNLIHLHVGQYYQEQYPLQEPDEGLDLPDDFSSKSFV